MISRAGKSIIFFTIFVLFQITNAQTGKWTANDIYKDCEIGGAGEFKKLCFGETEKCIEEKNCNYVVTASENGTHFTAETQTKCDGRTDYGAFFGVGVRALSKKNAKNKPEYKCTPKFEDFRFVILPTSDEIKCESKGELQKKWGILQKGLLRECGADDPRDVTDLQDFVTDNMMVQSGVIPTERIAQNNYTVVNGIFFNAGLLSTSTSLLLLTTCICAVFGLRHL